HPRCRAGRPPAGRHHRRRELERHPLIKSRLAGGFRLRAPAQGACTYANICEHCPSFHAEASFLPVLAAQRADAIALAEDAQKRGWITEPSGTRRSSAGSTP
ncbi:MAG TPA: hypothetical protein VN961_04190, partial [Streptosporangiaceae bacterium]|nr:hypothetical protein [Streptosporangiaceae bacterium]